MMTEKLTQLYVLHTGHEPQAVEAFPASGSNRRYFRLTGTPTLIGVAGESVEENRAFLYMADHFRRKGLPVPQVLARSADDMLYLQEDLGDVSLFQFIAKGRSMGTFSEEEKAMLRKVVRLLPAVQFRGAEGMDFSRCYPQEAFNSRCVLWDLNYFKYCFLRATGISFQEDRLEDDFLRMSEVLTGEETACFMYRDFQSRNIMLRDGEPWLIDFQGGRRGTFYYDVASFLWQAKAGFPETLRRELLEVYLEELKKYHAIEETRFYDRLRHFVLFRTLQVLGAYGFRGYFERKAHFLESIPFAIENLRRLLQEPFGEYPYLCHVLRTLTEHFADNAPKIPAAGAAEKGEGLTVTVTSFSYKKGIPEDTSGNGGGFVFDCRAVHNPGRYEEYKQLTGLDVPVIRFLEENGEMTRFMEHVYALVDASVERYLSRGFTNLCASFGCTGGQHRSVYGAQHLAEHLHDKYGVRVKLIHREQNIKQILA